MSAQIQPALTPKEWQDVPRLHGEVPSLGFVLDCIQPDNFGAVAIANALLPDDDQRKITLDKVVKLTQAAHFLTEQKGGMLSTKWPDDANPWHQLADELRQFAEQLRALLPPVSRSSAG